MKFWYAIMILSLSITVILAQSTSESEGHTLGVDAPKEAPQPESTSEGPLFRFVNEPNCLTALELTGTWVPDDELTKKIDGEISYDFDGFNGKCEKIVITGTPKDQTKLEKYLTWNAKEFQAQKPLAEDVAEEKRIEVERQINDVNRAMQNIYFAGSLELDTGEKEPKVFPLVYITMWGNDALLFFYENDKGFQKNSVIMSLIRDPVGTNDLLFIGGRSLKSKFVGFVRETQNKEK